MDVRLQQRLSQVAKRLRSEWLGWYLTCVFLAAAVAAWVLSISMRDGRWVPDNVGWLWLGFTALAAVIGFVVIRSRFRNLSEVAQRLETTFPDLNQRLLTATSLRPQNEHGEFGFLQRTVIDESLQHDLSNPWWRIVTPSRLLSAWLMNIPALAIMLLTALTLWRDPDVETLQRVSDSVATSALNMPLVAPGNTEVPRGSSCVVTATFPGPVPARVQLIRDSIRSNSNSGEAAQSSTTAMQRSMSDPVFASFVSSVTESFEYRIEFGGQQTQTYSIRVFDYPDVVRSDAQLEYPRYTGLETKTVLDTRRVTAATGTELTWLLHLNKPIASGQLLADGELPIQLTLETLAGDELSAAESGSTAVEGRIGEAVRSAATQPGSFLAKATVQLFESKTWTLELVDFEDRKNNLEIKLSARVLPNKPPILKLTAGGDAVVSPLEEFKISADVRDDFGLQAAGIGYQIGGGSLREISLEEASSDSQLSKLSVQQLLDFEALQAEPDQLLSYYTWAEDLDDMGKIRRTVGDVYFVEVRPFDEIFRQGQQPTADQQQAQQGQSGPQGNQGTEQLLEIQKQIIVGTWNVMRRVTDSVPADSASDLQTLIESQQQAIEMLAEKAAENQDPNVGETIEAASAAMDTAVESLLATADDRRRESLEGAMQAEQAAYQELLRMQSREHEVVQSQQQSQQGQGQSQRSQSRQQQIDELKLQNQENRYQEERLAQEQAEDPQAEIRQVISRLRELAARQEDINDQLREIDAALKMAETEKEKEELRRELERLREQQQELLQDSDELQQRMESQGDPALQEASEKLQDTRENLQQANEALRQGETSEALAAGSRAEESLNELKDEVRQDAAGQFAESMRDMQRDASELQDRQEEVLDQLRENTSQDTSSGLRSDETEDNATELLKQQRADLRELLEQMRETVETAEEAEPLLAQKLYDAYRRTEQKNAQEQLELTELLLERNLLPQAAEQADLAAENISELREDIDAAAEAVLGSEVDALKRALSELDELTRAVDDEMAEATGGSAARENSADGESSQGGDQPNGASEASAIEPPNAPDEDANPDSERSGAGNNNAESPEDPNERPASEQPAGDQNSGDQNPGDQNPGDQNPNGQNPNGQAGEGQSAAERAAQAQPQDGQPQPGQAATQGGSAATESPSGEGRGAGGDETEAPQRGLRGGGQSDSQEPPSASGGSLLGGSSDQGQTSNWSGGERIRSPLTGEGFREWADGLREVEELVADPELRWEATRIRQAARDLRRDLNRNSEEPRWAEVEDLVARPLRELQRKVSQELLRRVAKKTELIPVDRDPVPSEFTRQVETYYENLGSGR